MLVYDVRVKLEIPFDYCRIHEVPDTPRMASFTRMLWYGYDEDGPSVYRQNPKTGEVVRIDFLHT